MSTLEEIAVNLGHAVLILGAVWSVCFFAALGLGMGFRRSKWNRSQFSFEFKTDKSSAKTDADIEP